MEAGIAPWLDRVSSTRKLGLTRISHYQTHFFLFLISSKASNRFGKDSLILQFGGDAGNDSTT
jgi:hypothetical protein